MSDLGKHIEIVARHYWGEPNIKLSNALNSGLAHKAPNLWIWIRAVGLITKMMLAAVL